MNLNKDYDLVIVGSGPAGLSTALHLVQMDANWGQRMLVLEKASHPRQKLCGGGVTRSGLRILKELGFSLPLPLSQETVDHILLQYQGRTIHVRGQPQFVVFHRPEFDHFLAKYAQEKNIRLQENEPVLSLERKSDCFHVKTNRDLYQTRMVVGADSVRGPVRTWLRSQVPKKEPGKIGRTLEVLTPAQVEGPRFQDHSAIFDFSPIRENLQGYVWDFPSKIAGKPTHNRGIYDSRFSPQRPRAQLPSLLNRSLVQFGAIPGEGEVKSTPIHWFSPWQTLSGPGVLLVGDAAGIESLFGEGIGPALAYGKVAAAEIQHSFRENDFSFDCYRRRLLRSPLGKYMTIRWLGSTYLYRLGRFPVFPHILWTIGQFLAKIWHAGPLK